MGVLIITLLTVLPLWNICERVGVNPAISLIAIIPFLGFLIVVAILASSPWPTLERKNIDQGMP